MSTDCMAGLFYPATTAWFHETLGEPTPVQREAWPAIAAGSHTLVSAPTGTGKTLSAFLVFIDQLMEQARRGELKEELQLIYISPLKSLAGDIRENLRRPLDGIWEMEHKGEQHPKGGGSAGDFLKPEITVAIRTGDTTQSERRRMIKHPPHILITTPESLYLLLTSQSGRSILKTARAIIIDELHALIDTKRGAHLMLSAARLDMLCGRPLQRIGLSATIEPLSVAAEYLAPEPAVVVAPKMKKEVLLAVTSPMSETGQEMQRDTLWEELADTVYHYCLDNRSVIAFVEGRRYAEKLAYYVNQLGGDGFARTHHGSLSKEQRMEVEESLRDGKLRLLCATSSMELGIDVGDIDLVLQMGCPRTISGTMQRLGRAGHNPGRVSVMRMFPRTAPESLYCGLTAELARRGGVEEAHPPRLCLDVLAQHLVSLASVRGYQVDEVMELLPRACPFRQVTREDVESVLRMLAGDYEHSREIPVRPRLLYDRINGWVEGDAYSRMLAISAGGTIPDKGMYAVKTPEGVKLGELDEEFVFEARVGEKFLLGTFAWKILRMDRDTVVVEQAPAAGAKLPFWKGEMKGRDLKTGLEFGKILRHLAVACESGDLEHELTILGLDAPACEKAAGFLRRQIEATGVLPDDHTVVVEHYRDHTGSSQIMVHSLFGRQVNAPLAILAQQEAVKETGQNVGCVDDESGFLLYPFSGQTLPEGIFKRLDPDKARAILEAVLPSTPLFNMTFRYNAGRALMMGIRKNGRQPLWMQRLRSAEMMDSLLAAGEHPLIRETRRECLEDQWDIDGVEYVLSRIRSGAIVVHEIWTETPSPMSLPLQWQVEAAVMYDYYPATKGVPGAVEQGLSQAEMIKPAQEELKRVSERASLPEDAKQLHTLLMMEGDLVAGELPLPLEWLEELAGQGRVMYREPGIWIAAEQQEEYEAALDHICQEARQNIVRRLLYYRGPHTAGQLAERYFWEEQEAESVLEELCRREQAVKHGELYYHEKRYDKARRETVKNMRREAATMPPSKYAALRARRVRTGLPAAEQLELTMGQLWGQPYPAALWETVLLPGRVKDYRPQLLDTLLSSGDYFWQLLENGSLVFWPYDQVDWDAPLPEWAGGNVPPAKREKVTPPLAKRVSQDEELLYRELQRRGASFMNTLARLPQMEDFQGAVLALAEQGVLTADNFTPVRQWLERDKFKKASVRQRVSARVKLINTGRCDLVRGRKQPSLEEQIERAFDRQVILCRETARAEQLNWSAALEILRVWEYTGRARRGYFIQGLSGAQFIRAGEYAGVMAELEERDGEVIWLSAVDPAQVWGKTLAHLPDRGFLNVPGTAAALLDGLPVAAFERQGKTLRVYELDGEELTKALITFAQDYRRKRIYPETRRLVVKEYPAEAAESMRTAGFVREMGDWVLYR